jgi:hypothetical protein
MCRLVPTAPQRHCPFPLVMWSSQLLVNATYPCRKTPAAFGVDVCRKCTDDLVERKAGKVLVLQRACKCAYNAHTEAA